MVEVGAFVASGGTSDIYRLGNDAVVKIPRPGVPSHWARKEAELTAAVHSTGLPVPAARELIRLDGRDCVVLDRIDGASMWDRMCDRPVQINALCRTLADIQLAIQRTSAPATVPRLHERLQQKLRDVRGLPDADLRAAQALLADLPAADTLYHGDLHPGNVLMSATGPVVIDWFDAAAGVATADVVRTSLLIRPSTDPSSVTPHLPGATRELLARIHDTYLDCLLADCTITLTQVTEWEALQALSRLSEGAQRDESGLWRIWQRRAVSPPAGLAAAIAAHQTTSI